MVLQPILTLLVDDSSSQIRRSVRLTWITNSSTWEMHLYHSRWMLRPSQKRSSTLAKYTRAHALIQQRKQELFLYMQLRYVGWFYSIPAAVNFRPTLRKSHVFTGSEHARKVCSNEEAGYVYSRIANVSENAKRASEDFIERAQFAKKKNCLPAAYGRSFGKESGSAGGRLSSRRYRLGSISHLSDSPLSYALWRQHRLVSQSIWRHI